MEDVFVGDEAELPKKVYYDTRPSKEEVELHNTTHLPYRSWCPHCVKGKAKRRHHRRKEQERKSGVPVISVDYMWLKGKKGDGEDENKGNPILVMRCSDSKLIWSKVVLRKGVEPYSVKVACDMIAFSGHRKVILKSDGESSITALKDAVKASCDVSMSVEVSPMGDSQANGEVERAIQTVQGQVRTMKSALDSKYRTELGENHVLIPWLVSYASSVINKFTIDTGGKTAHERCRGRRFNRQLPEFGECVMYHKTMSKKHGEKLISRWESGIYLGINESSQELIMGTPSGAVKASEFKRKGSEEESWNLDELSAMQGLPWKPDPNTAGYDVKTRVIVPIIREPGEKDQPDTRPIISRGVAVKKAEYLAMGPTAGCYGCKALVRGDTSHKPHNAECRQRVIEWLKAQSDHSIQSRLASAQERLEVKGGEDDDEVPGRKRARVVMEDNWVITGNKAVRQHRTPRHDLYVPGNVRQKDGKQVHFKDERKTQLINISTGEMHEFEDNWRQVGPLRMDYEWTGFTELTIAPDDASSPPVSSNSGLGPGWTKVGGTATSVKRGSNEMSGEVDEEDLQPNKSPMVEGDPEDTSMNEIRQGLNMLGFTDEIVNWLLGENLEIINEVNEIRRAVRLYGKGQQQVQSHISEAYSPVRVTGMADKMGLVPGLAMDLTTYDEHGNPWDFNVPAMRKKAKAIVKSKAALLLVVSPMCSAFSRLQAFNVKRLGEERVKEMLDMGIKHLNFAMELCEIQRRNGLYFLFEHPAGASSWSVKSVQNMLSKASVFTYEGDMCQFNMKQSAGGEELFVKKPTRFLTNSPLIGRELNRKCQGTHRHIELTGSGRTKKSEVYPDAMCQAILSGLVKQMQVDDRVGCSFKADEVNFDDEVEFVGDELRYLNEVSNEVSSVQKSWTRTDMGTSRLMLPGEQGPNWTQCTWRVTKDIDTGQTLEDRSVNEITGYEKRREFRQGNRNISTTFTYNATGDTKPQKWKCDKCQHEGWLKTPGICEACDSVGTLKPQSRENIMVVHRQEDGKAYAWDDVSGNELDIKLTLKARMEEMDEFKKHGVYEKVREEVCWAVTGKGPIGTRWIDINKGDEVKPEYRSRLVAQQVKCNSKEKNIFAATPPLEAQKLLFSMAVTEGIGYRKGEKEKGMKLGFIDVKRAYFYAKAKKDIFVKLPPEDNAPGMCGKLLKSMYGTRDAASNWEDCYMDFAKSIGFESGLASPCVFKHRSRKLWLTVHGDDFTLLGSDSDLDWFERKIKEEFEVKIRGRLGPGGKEEDQSIRILNRIIEWNREGVWYEADQRHAEIIVRELGLEGNKVRSEVPGEKVTMNEEDEEELSAGEVKRFQALVARANYLAQDRSDIQYAVKELCRKMSCPTRGSWRALVKLGKYLKSHSRYSYLYKYQDLPRELTIWTDTDYAGCKTSRKSTSGGVVMWGKHIIKSWSSTQSVIALSSGEAEYYGMVKGASVGLGMQSVLKDFEIEVKLTLKSDASAAIAIASRRGLGKVRHIEVCQLWLQEKVRSGVIKVVKVGTDENIADSLTKYVGSEILKKHLHETCQLALDGRHRLAPATEC